MKKSYAIAVIVLSAAVTVCSSYTYHLLQKTSKLERLTQDSYWETIEDEDSFNAASTEAPSAKESVIEDTATTEDVQESADEVPSVQLAEEVPSSAPVTTPTKIYTSELTGLPEDASLQNQRPIAVMIDNDPRALPHYGLSDADVVYEMVNSLANNRVTRLMGLYKNWQNVSQIGNIRSTRPTNVLLAPEWNAVLIHDGGPFYNDPYFQSTGLAHLSGGFSRIRNGKATEFTEYLTGSEVVKRFQKAGYSSAYTNYRPHWDFANVDLTSAAGSSNASSVDLNAFRLTKPSLKYDSSTGLYQYYENGSIAKDGNTGAVPAFKNVILQECIYHQYDANGYLIYNIIADKMPGWYITNGKAIPITWSKLSETGVTRYYDLDGNPITINPGKTYIGIVPDDGWNEITIR